MVRGAYAKGLLLDKPLKSYLNWSEEEVGYVRELLKGEARNLSEIRSLTLSYCLSHPAVASVVSGIRTVDQLHESIEAIARASDMEEKISKLKDLLPQNIYQDHR